MSTRRLEMHLEELRVKSASQLTEPRRKSDAVNPLKIELSALRDKVGAARVAMLRRKSCDRFCWP